MKTPREILVDLYWVAHSTGNLKIMPRDAVETHKALKQIQDHYLSLLPEKKKLVPCSAKNPTTYMSYELGYNQAINDMRERIKENSQ